MQNKIKSLLIVTTGFIAVITLISLLMPSTVINAETVMVNAEKSKIASAISDLNNWKYWHPVFMQEQSMQIPSPAEARWETGGMINTMKVISADSSVISIQLNREGQRSIQNYFSIDAIKDQPGLQVEWRVITTLKWYPWEKFGGMMMGAISKQGYQEALLSLKKHLEN